MNASRRDFFLYGAAVAAASCFPEALAAATRQPQGEEAARQAFLAADPLLTRSVLAGLVGSAFRVASGRRSPLELRLAEVADLPSASAAGTEGSELCFSATFRGPARRPLTQGTHVVTQAALGTFPLFLVPVGPPGREVWYEAVFNRPEA